MRQHSSAHSPARSRSADLVATVVAGVALIATLATPATLDAQQPPASTLRYALLPTFTRLLWGDDVGLEDTDLYGARLGLTFGEYIGLQGHYLAGPRSDTRFAEAGFTRPDGTPLPEQRVDVRSYGADVLVNIGRHGLDPFLKLGGGVLRFAPDEGRPTEQVVLKYGGGLRVLLAGNVRLQAFVEDQRFRLDRYLLGPAAEGEVLPRDAGARDVRRALALGAGITIPFGAATPAAADDRPRLGLREVGLPLELMAGRLDFDDGRLARQAYAGARTGVDFGRLVGLRGYYWRGVSDAFDRATEVQSWGGEAHFNLTTARALAPYLIAGAGELDFRDDYRDRGGNRVDDRRILILGGGVRFGLTDNVHLNVAARDYLMSRGTELQDVASADELRSNWTYSAGLAFTLGGRPGRDRVAPPIVPFLRRNADSLATAALRDSVRLLRDSLARRAGPAIAAGVDSAVPVDSGTRVPSSYVGARTITVPVPIEGEIVLRYGPAGAPTGAAGRDSVLRSAPGLPARPTDTTLAMLEDRIVGRLASQIVAQSLAYRASLDSLLRAELARQQQTATPAPVSADRIAALVDARLQEREAAREAVVVTPARGDAAARPRRSGLRAAYGYAGLAGGNGTQAVVGGRADVGPISPGFTAIALVPELAFGFGGGATSSLLSANAQLPLPGIRRVSPYLGLGLGLLYHTAPLGDRDGLDVVLNPAVGARLGQMAFRDALGVGSAGAFVEYQGVGLFDQARVLAGLTWQF